MRFHKREATKIELLEGSLRESDLNVTLPRTTNNSITLAKLLKNVEKSYERGRKLLDYVVANILRNMESNHISEEKNEKQAEFTDNNARFVYQ